MTVRPVSPQPAITNEQSYEAPRLTVIGRAVDVVLGPPGCGWDGPCGITEPQFEFEPDDQV